MKKTIFLALITVVIISLVGCKKQEITNGINIMDRTETKEVIETEVYATVTTKEITTLHGRLYDTARPEDIDIFLLEVEHGEDGGRKLYNNIKLELKEKELIQIYDKFEKGDQIPCRVVREVERYNSGIVDINVSLYINRAEIERAK